MTGKERMLNAYRGLPSDRIAIAPEFWYYYPAKLLGVDMITFAREVPFHQALKKTFDAFGCEGWGASFGGAPVPDVESKSEDRWIDDNTLEIRSTTKTPYGTLTSGSRQSRDEPGWCTERPIKDLERDMPAFEHLTFARDYSRFDPKHMRRAWEDVGDSYLLEGWLDAMFFDWFAGSREGGLEQAILDFADEEERFLPLHERYLDLVRRHTRAMCEKTPFESFVIGCSWSCNSLIGPAMWRKWDKPVVAAMVDEAHRHGRLVHIHFHGRCREALRDLVETGIDCICPFERGPGGDIDGLAGLTEAASALDGRCAMNGNVHTVETLIRGTPADVRREVGEIIAAFRGNPRVIIGTGDQVGRETPEANLHAMIDEAKRLGTPWPR